MTEITFQHSLVLPARPPYRFAASLRAMGSYPPGAADQVLTPGSARRALIHPGRSDTAVLVELSGLAHPGVVLRIAAAEPLSPTEVAGVAAAVTRWLGLTDDLSDFLAVARRDPAFAPVLAATAGLHQVRFPSLTEGTSYFVLTQRTSEALAAVRKRRLADAYGPRLSFDGVEFRAFPALAALTGRSAAELADHVGLRHAGRLASVLTGLAALDERELREAPYDRARDALLGLPGVGPFTAQAILLRVLGRPDDAPLEMGPFAQAVAEIYGPGTPAAEVRYRYGDQVGWWAYFARTARSWRDEPAGAAGTVRSAA